MDILFECNRQKCGDKCSYPDCHLTTNIYFAKNFKVETQRANNGELYDSHAVEIREEEN